MRLEHRISMAGLSWVSGGCAAMLFRLLFGRPLGFMWGFICMMSITFLVAAGVLTAEAFDRKRSNNED